MLTEVLPPDDWYPDPTGRHQHRRFEGGRWRDWVATAGQVGHDPMPPAPASGGGTLTTEPVIHSVPVEGGWTLVSLGQLPLAMAAGDGRTLTISDPSGAPTHQLRRSVAGSTNLVSLIGLDDRELGRFEEVRRADVAGFRVVGLGALLAKLDGRVGDHRHMLLADPGGRPLGRMSEDGGRWTTELAHPLGPPLGQLAALAVLAVSLTRT